MIKSNRFLAQVGKLANAYAPVVLWAGVIFMFSSQQVLPSLTMNGLDFMMKKFAHMGVYAVLYFLLVRAHKIVFPATSPATLWRWPLALCFVYAISDELHQALTGGNRSPSPRDVVFDMLGAGIALLRQYKYI